MMTQIIQAFENFTFTRECAFEILKDFLAPFKIYLDIRKQAPLAELCFTCPEAVKPIRFTVACDKTAMPSLKVSAETEHLLELEFKQDILLVTHQKTADGEPTDFSLLKICREIIEWLVFTVQKYMLRVAPCARA